jgi:hypothetical protein
LKIILKTIIFYYLRDYLYKMEQLGDLINLVDDIKEKIDDAQYKKLVDTLKSINDNRDYPDLYLVKYWEQSTKLIATEEEEPIHYKIKLEKKCIVAKFCRRTFENEEQIDNYVKYFEDMKNLYIRTNHGFPLIQMLGDLSHGGGDINYIRLNPDKQDYRDLPIEYNQFIPISIKKI